MQYIKTQGGFTASTNTYDHLCQFAIQVYKVFFRTMNQHFTLEGFKFVLLLKQYFLYV